LTRAFPAILVVLTALIASGFVHAGFALWWFVHYLLGSPASFYWTSSLSISAAATTLVLIAGLVARRLVMADVPSSGGETIVRAAEREPETHEWLGGRFTA
jgi:hypothetical protein